MYMNPNQGVTACSYKPEKSVPFFYFYPFLSRTQINCKSCTMSSDIWFNDLEWYIMRAVEVTMVNFMELYWHFPGGTRDITAV
jgi:hypothetical protein